jgi:hypothetical protein
MRDRAILRKIVKVEYHRPDEKHDTRRLECGHVRIVPRARLHPMRSNCEECRKRETMK